ncbi:hypothetical protein AVEN_125348-1 [Araneus ventricosus]|uniref:Tc1-like transposase DDE domain-containing protein n=1 Tax=Araneus ventricosus TaxID=182803 RepID=A0A4Y2IF13_ARAVE|nr:hypothetical protein AVEN_125348-1 [Araneus ventricosus]
MGKAADLSEFDRGQIVMARRLGTSITETARLVGCSRSAVVSIHAKWINDGDTSSRRQGVGRPHVIKEKGRRRLSRLGTPSARRTAAPLLHSRSYTDWWWQYYALGDVLMGGSGIRSCDRTDHESCKLSEHHYGSAAPNMVFVFPTGNGIFQQDNTPCHKAWIVLEWFEEHTDEFHLMSWPPNSPDLNLMEHIWDVMERQLTAQTPPCPNISTLRDCCLDIWYNLSPVMYQKLVASMPR